MINNVIGISETSMTQTRRMVTHRVNTMLI